MAANSPIENLTAEQQVQFFYVTFYGRPADPTGLAFWTNAVKSVGILNVVKDFGSSPESAALYGSLSTRDKIAKMYLTTFGREADPGGLNYWTNLVGTSDVPDVNQVVVHMYNAMAPEDRTAVNNRQTVADSFTQLLKTDPGLQAAWADDATRGKAGQTLATWMASVTADPASVTVAQNNSSVVVSNITSGTANTAVPVFAAASTLTMNEDGAALTGKAVATDADNIPTVVQKLTYELVGTGSAKGNAVTIDATTGNFSYTPAKDFNGADSFTVAANVGAGGRTLKVFSVDVASVNDKPEFAANTVKSITTSLDKAVTGTVVATDVDGDKLSYSAANGKLGTVTISNASTGAYVYTPSGSGSGNDSFVITVSDGKGGTDTVAVSVSVTAKANAVPVAKDDTATAVSGNSVVVKVLDNDSDADNDSLSIVSAVPSRGSVEVNKDGTITYTALDGDGSSTPDSVIYTISDGKGGTASATLNVNVVTRTGGSSGNDVLGGGVGNDVINALGGDDIINGGGGLDRITAGDGNDTVLFSDEANFIRGGNDTDTLRLPFSGDFRFDLGSSTNQYTGTAKNATGNAVVTVLEFEVIDARTAEAAVYAQAAAAGNTIYGSVMADSLVGSTGADYFDGGRGNDTLIGGGGVDTLMGGSGADSILGAGVIDGGVGADSITTNGTAMVTGDADHDYIVVGGSGNISGGTGNDTIVVGATGYSALTLSGNDGNDSIFSNSTADSLVIDGGSGADTIRVDGLNDSILGGDGNDYIVLTGTDLSSAVSVHGGAGVDTLSVLADSAMSAGDFKNMSGIEVLQFNYDGGTVAGASSYTIDGVSISGGIADLTTIYLGGADSVSDTLTLKNISQPVTVVINNDEITDSSYTSISADSTTGSIIIVADSLSVNDTLSLHGANDYFRDTIEAGATYAFAANTGVEFIELTGKASTNASAAVSIASGQSLTLTSVAGDSVSINVALTNGGSAADTVTVTGGSWHDVINLSGVEKATVYGGSGADSITYTAGDADTVIVYGGDGADTIIAGKWDSVYGDNVDGGSGDDLIILSSSADSTTYVNGGAGTDIVRLGDSATSSSSLNQLVSIEGLDFTAVDMAMTLSGGSSGSALFTTIYADGDSLTFASNYAADGTTAITLTNGTAAGDTAVRIIADSLSDLRITANNGIDSTDTIDAGAETSPTATLDIISASISKAATAVSFALNEVNNVDELNISRASGATAAATVTVTAADSIAVNMVASLAADSLSLDLTAGAGGMVTVTGGAGADTILLTDATRANRYTEIDSVVSADTVMANQAGESVSDYLATGAGADSILADARDTVYAGSGNDTVISIGMTAGDSLNVLTIYADTGNDWISIDGAYDYVDAGGGDDRIVLTSNKVGLSQSIIGGAGSDTLSLSADSTGVYADSAFANLSDIEVLDLRNSGADAVTLGAEADQAGIIRVLADAADSITLLGMGAVQVDAATSGTGNFRLTSDSLTTVTLFADTGASFDQSDIIQLSTVTGGGDVLSIRGAAADSVFAFDSTDRGLDSIIVRGDVTRTVHITGVGSDSLAGLTIQAADTAVSLNIVVAGADSLTYIILGNVGGDSVTATGGTISVLGGAGADSITSSAARANDYIDVSGGTTAADSNFVSAGDGNDTIIGGFGNDTIYGGTGVERILSGSGDDIVIIASAAADSLTADFISLGAGADSLDASGAVSIGVEVYLGNGADSVTLSNLRDSVFGDAADTGADVIVAGSGSDYVDLSMSAAVTDTNRVDLGADSDQFFGGASADSVSGGAGHDTIITGAGADIVFGDDGNDSISVGLTAATAGDSNFASGGAGDDTLVGGGLNDTLDGGSGNDSISAGGGADSIHVGNGLDWVDAGDGNDIVIVSSDGFEAFLLNGVSVYDTLKGGAGADSLVSSFSGDTTLGAQTTFLNNLGQISEFEWLDFTNSSGTTSVLLNDSIFDSGLTLSFRGAASVNVNNIAVSESGTLTITADTAVAALTVAGNSKLTEVLEVYASDSLDADLRFTSGSGSDKLVILGQTLNGVFDLDDVAIPSIELRGDTDGGYNLDYERTTKSAASLTVSLTGGQGADTTKVVWSSAADSIALTIYTTGGADSIFTGDGADFISVGVGADTISSKEGNDTIVASDGANSVNAGAGNDSVSLGGGADTVFAEAGNDVIWLGAGANVAILGAGIDTVYGGSGADSIDGTADSLGDFIYLYAGSDTVYAGSGNDVIDVSGVGADSDFVSAGNGTDSVVTGEGNDTVWDQGGTDSIWVGAGNDSIYLHGTDAAGMDYIYLGLGADTLLGSADSGGLMVSVDAGSGNDIILTGTGNDSIFASIGADSINAGAGRDTIFAQGVGAAADTMSDTVIGGFGADYIDLGFSAAGDTDYLIFDAATVGTITNQALSTSQHSSYVALDTIANFDPYSASSAAESVSFDVFSFNMSFDGADADSIASGSYITSGVLGGDAFDQVSTLPGLSLGGQLSAAVSAVEGWLGNELTTGEVFAFQWSSNWYVGVGIGQGKVGTVVHFAGVDIDALETVSAGVYRIIDNPGS